MATSSTDNYTRQTVIIVFLWLLVMLIGGVLLIRYGGVLQSVFGF